MHYKDGSPAASGHVVLGPPSTHPSSPQVVGTVVGTLPGTACNLFVQPSAFIFGAEGARFSTSASPSTTAWTMTAGECSRIA